MAKKKEKLKRLQYNQIFLKKHFENDSRDPSEYIMSEEIAWLKHQGYRMRTIKPRNQDSEWITVEYHFWVPERIATYMMLRWPNSTHEYEIE